MPDVDIVLSDPDAYLATRHPSVAAVAQYVVKVNPNLPQPLKGVAEEFAELAAWLLCEVEEDGPELTAGLRKLLESKDCCVRAAL